MPERGPDRLREAGLEAVEAGRLEEALDWFDRAMARAEAEGDDAQRDLALCNRAAVAIELGRADPGVPALRAILVRNGGVANCRLAAYHLGRYYELAKDYKKALFYARIALDRSQQLDRPDWLASSHNLVGNALLAESQIELALQHYRQALELMPGRFRQWRASILNNIGYCRVLQEDPVEGFRCLHASLRTFRTPAGSPYEVRVRLDLCYAHLEHGRYGHARRHGERALRMAEALGDADAEKNALFLLGETASLRGDDETAQGLFDRLHHRFFPTADYLPGFLMSVDVRKLINLHA